jgi:hypothetical protein
MSYMSHTIGINTTGGSYTSKFEEFSSYVNVGGVGGYNHTLHLVNPPTNMSLESKS